jgi:hypothetical protein
VTSVTPTRNSLFRHPQRRPKNNNPPENAQRLHFRGQILYKVFQMMHALADVPKYQNTALLGRPEGLTSRGVIKDGYEY